MTCSLIPLALVSLPLSGPTGIGGSEDLPDLPEPVEFTETVQRRRLVLEHDELRTKLWIYTPKAPPAEGTSRPCVLIAPAGTALWHGIGLGRGDEPEHLPWVEAGYVVVAYSISGPFDGVVQERNLLAALDPFLAARGGILNARAALDYALSKVEGIDPERIFTSGHSSAATLSLQVAQSDERIRGCVALAPCTDLVDWVRVAAESLEDDFDDPRLGEYALAYCPSKRVEALKCPVFLFHAKDDDVVPVRDTRRFERALKRAKNEDVVLVEVRRGGHYESMIDVGLPRAIAWANELAD